MATYQLSLTTGQGCTANVHSRHGYWIRYAVCSAYVRSVTTQQIETGPPHLAQPVGSKCQRSRSEVINVTFSCGIYI